jgi:type II secretory pathway pseudopilin PulG
MPHRFTGFSLVEVALVLLILGVTTWALAGSFGNTAAVTERDAARSHGQIMQNALSSFALAQGRLPCPDTVALDTGNSGWETLSAPGVCAAASTETGMLPYKSLGLDIPDKRLRAAYGVYRNAAVNADLTQLLERTDIPALPTSALNARDLIIALNFAAAMPTANTHLYLTGDNQTLGAVDCAANVRANAAFVLVMPLRDRDGAGNEFDGIHNAFASSASLCASAPGTPMSAQNDDVVVAESFASLGGWLLSRVP